jgi:acetyltransferase
VTVLDAWQGQGLGTILMRRLIDAARERGLQRMVSLDFAENQEMAHLAHPLGFHTVPDPDDRTQVVHTLIL